MKKGNIVRLNDSVLGKIESLNETEAKVLLPSGEVKTEPLETIEVVYLFFEVFKFIFGAFEVKLPRVIKIGGSNFCLVVRWSEREGRFFAYYLDDETLGSHEEKVLIGVSGGSNTREAKKNLKDKLKQAGYL